MKCQNLFSGKNKNIIDLSSAALAQRVIKVKYEHTPAELMSEDHHHLF